MPSTSTLWKGDAVYLLPGTLTRIGEERAEDGERMDPVETILAKLVKCINLLPDMLAMVPID